VTRDVRSYALMVGNPARQTGWMCACGVKLAGGARPPASAACGACGLRYTASGDELQRA
jgi:UDP-2-acetamido-3-amino-2,3-dideoxy-glucuronate N-acetyltransferase